jgi:DMSO/TMAO reductase YedYZ molybdopterin-dependent catalytic subunit
MLLARSVVLCSLPLILAACAEPPDKEIHQAQGALDAARAAGAEVFAAAEYEAAATALEKARQAVAQRDYRLALNHALDSRERAEAAARSAADEKARARVNAERAWQTAQQGLQASQEALERASRSQVSDRVLKPLRATVEAIAAELPVLRTRIDEGEYLETATSLDAVAARLTEAQSEIDAAIAARPAARPRRR